MISEEVISVAECPFQSAGAAPSTIHERVGFAGVRWTRTLSTSTFDT